MSTTNRKMKNGNKTENWKWSYCMMGIGSKVGFVPIFYFFSFPVLRARYSLPVTVTSRFESLKHVMEGFKDVKESNSVYNLDMTKISTVGYHAAFCRGGCRRVPRFPGVILNPCFLSIDFFPFRTGACAFRDIFCKNLQIWQIRFYWLWEIHIIT